VVPLPAAIYSWVSHRVGGRKPKLTARQIPSHGFVTFAMRIAVPVASGQAKYDWQLQDTDVATAGMVVVRQP
jgi:hypothetical protein